MYSVLVDTCTLTPYSKKGFYLFFLYYIIDDSLAPSGDTLNKEWNSISSKFITIRAELDTLEQRFGHFVLRHDNQGGGFNLGDTNNFAARGWNIIFDNYVNVDSVVFYLNKIPYRDTAIQRIVYFYGYPLRKLGIVTQNIMKQDVQIWPQPSRNDIYIEGIEAYTDISLFDMEGKQVLFSIKERNSRSITLDVSRISSGYYILKISDTAHKILIHK